MKRFDVSRVHGASVDQMAPPAAEPAALDFGSFYANESLRLRRALFLLTDDPDQAEELAQEAMVRVFERWRKVRAMDSPTGYLYRVALNVHRSRLRRLLVQSRRTPAASAVSDGPSGAVELHDQLGRALASLPPKQREAVVLVEWMGLSADDAAAVLKIEPVSVRVRLSRARSALRTWIQEDEIDD